MYTQVEHCLEVAYPASDMYSLVNDIESYPEFLPGCTEGRLLETGPNYVIARLAITGMGFSQSFTTRNQLESPHRITMQLVEGPFKHLTGNWEFTSLGDEKSKVKLTVCFEFSTRYKLFQFALRPVLNNISKKLTEAFEQRAQYLKSKKDVLNLS